MREKCPSDFNKKPPATQVKYIQLFLTNGRKRITNTFKLSKITDKNYRATS